MKYLTTFQRSTLSCADKLSSSLHRIGTKLFGAYPEEGKQPVSERQNKVSALLFGLLCAFSVLSQTDVIAAFPYVRLLVIALWIPAFLYAAVRSRLHLGKHVLASLFPLVVFDCLVLVIGFVRGCSGVYLSSPIFYAANLSAFVFVTGGLFGKIAGQDVIKKGIRIYILCTLCVAIYTILTTFFTQGLSSYLYVYSRKNSLAPIVLTAICCVLFLKPFSHKEWHTPLLMIFGTFLVLLKSRSNFIGFFAVLVIWYIFSLNGKESRKQVFLNLLTAAFLILAVSTLRDLVIDNILLNHRASEGLSGISSGRTDQIAEAVQTPVVQGSRLFGNGYTYIESLPLAVILSYGILSLIPLVAFAFVPLHAAFCAKRAKLSKGFVLFLFAISVAFLINGIFEERAPFGPGTTYFMLWFISGFSLAKEEKNEKNEKNKKSEKNTPSL